MLGMRKCYVDATCYTEAYIERWANDNGIEIIGGEMVMAQCDKAYELNVSGNVDLALKAKLSGFWRVDFMNGRRRIGDARYVRDGGKKAVLVFPEFRDR